MDRFAEWVWRRLGAIAISVVPAVALALMAAGVNLLCFGLERGEALGIVPGVLYAALGPVAAIVSFALAWREWRKP